jgi:hypothetical protein
MIRTALVGNGFIIRFEENKSYNNISSSNTQRRMRVASGKSSRT